MAYGPIQVFYTGIASGASTSSYIDLGGKSYARFAVNAVTMSTGAQLALWGCDTASGTYFPIRERDLNTSTSGYQTMIVPTGTSGAWAVFNPPPFRYVEFIASAVVSGGVSITVLASD